MLASLGVKIGYVFGAISLAYNVFAFFFVPEIAVSRAFPLPPPPPPQRSHTQGRSLEEIDELYQARLWAWQFKTFETTGVGATIAQLEQGGGHISDETRAKLGLHAGHEMGAGVVDNEKGAVGHTENAT